MAQVVRGGTIVTEVACPCCGNEYNHVDRPPYFVDGRDEYAAGWGGRGDLLIVTFRGECGCEWDLCFGEHKGTTDGFIRVVVDCRSPAPTIRVGAAPGSSADE